MWIKIRMWSKDGPPVWWAVGSWMFWKLWSMIDSKILKKMEQNLQHLNKMCSFFCNSINVFCLFSLILFTCLLPAAYSCVTSSLNVYLKVRLFILNAFFKLSAKKKKHKTICLNEKEAASLKHGAALEKSVWICSSSHIKWIRTWLIFSLKQQSGELVLLCSNPGQCSFSLGVRAAARHYTGLEERSEK